MRNFGITIDRPAGVFSGKQSVVKNLIIPTSHLNKIHNSIFYHQVREAQAAEIIWVGWIEGIRKLADFFTNAENYIPTRQGIISKIFNENEVVATLYGG